jgi:hypothetical protein
MVNKVKAQSVPVVPVVQDLAAKKLPDTKAGSIWQEIAGVPIDAFAIPNQIVSDYFIPFFAEPDRLFLKAKTKATAAIQFLEATLAARCVEIVNIKTRQTAPKYNVELTDKYIIVSPISR